MIRRVRIVILAVLACLLVQPAFAFAADTPPTVQVTPSYVLSSLQDGVQGFLERRDSGLASTRNGELSAAQIIENAASYYNIDVRLLLAVLETTSGLVSAPTVALDQLEQPFGAGPHGFAAQIDWAARELRAGLGPYEAPPTLVFRDGQRRTLDLSEDVHGLTVKRLLAHERTLSEWEALVTAYPRIYTDLFRDEPTPPAPTPVARYGFLSTPWYAGTRVIHSSYFDHVYPMVDSGGDGNDIMVNYLGQAGLSYNSHDAHDYYFPDSPYGTPIIAAAPGWAFARTTRGLGVFIQHTDDAAGYETVYWHLEDFAPAFAASIDSATPRWVERGELLGWSGATGFTDGAPHLHFEVRHNGNQVDPYGWYGPGPDPCAAYAKCEPSVWLWDNSVPWSAPDAPRNDTTPPNALLTLNPDPHLRLLAQFEHDVLPTVGAMPNSQNTTFPNGRWGKAVRVGAGASLTYPASPTLNLAQGTLALWIDVPQTWSDSATGRHYLAAASANPADPGRIYTNTLALRHEQNGPDDQPVWQFWTVPVSATVANVLSITDTLQPGWHHFALTWNAISGTKALYIDGGLAAQAAGVVLPREVGEWLEIGRWTIDAGASSVPLDEIVSYDSELSAAAIRDLAQTQDAQSGSAERTASRDLLLLTPALDDGGGVVQAQLSINGKHAAPMPYYRAYRWMLPAEEGSYTVTVRLADRTGNTTTLTRTISVDHAPVASVQMRELTALSATLVLTATDANLPIEVAFSATPAPLKQYWEPLRDQRVIYWTPLQPRRVYVWFRDANGNQQGPFVAGPDLYRVYLPRLER